MIWYDIHNYTSRWRGNVRLNDDSNSRRCTLNALRVNLNRVGVHCRQSAREDKSHISTPRAERAWRLMDVLWHSACTETARRTLPRGPGLSPISKNMIRLASRFGYIIRYLAKWRFSKGGVGGTSPLFLYFVRTVHWIVVPEAPNY